MKPHSSVILILSLVALTSAPSHAAVDDSATGIRIYNGSNNSAIDLSTVPADKTTIIFNMAGSGTANWFTGNDHRTYAGNVQIGDGSDDDNLGLRINNGNKNSVSEFSGTVTGAGLLSKTGNGSDSKILFSGDVTAYTGAIQLGSASGYNFTLQFGNGEAATDTVTTTNGVSGTGTITFNGSNDTLVYDYASSSSTVYVTNAIAKGASATSKVTIANGAAMEFTQSVVIDTLAVNDPSAHLTFSGGGTLGTMTGTAAGIVKTGNNTLTITGNTGFDTQTITVAQGILEYKNSGGGHLGTVNLEAETTLGYFNTANNGPNTLTVDNLHLNGNATIQGELGGGSSWPSIFQTGNLTGENKTLTIDASAKATLTQWFVINGGSFSGALDIQQNDDGAGRKLVVSVTDTEALSNAVINLSTKNSSGDSLLVFAVGGAAGNEIKIAGLNGIAGSNLISGGVDANLNTTSLAAMQDGNVRTLTLTGNDAYTYNGTVGSNLVINKTGSGSQTLGNVGDNVSFHVASGSLTLAGALGDNVNLSAESNATIVKSGDGMLILGDLGENVNFTLESGSIRLTGTVGAGSTIVTSAGTSVYTSWLLNETATGSGIYTAALPGGNADFITGDGEILNSIVDARGDTSAHPADRVFTRLDTTGYANDTLEIASGLVSLITGNLDAPGTIADFGTIDKLVLNGGGLVWNTTDATFQTPFDKALEIKGDGFLRSYEGADMHLSGAVTGNGVLTKTDAGNVTLSGDMSGFAGSVAVGEGGLIFDTNATISSLQLATGAGAYLSVRNGHTLTVGGSSTVWTPNAGDNDIRVGEGSDIQINRIRFSQAASLNLTAEDGSYGSLTVAGLQCADTANTVINVGKNTALNLTGTDTGQGKTQGAFNSAATFLVTHYNSHADISVDGTLNMLNCDAFSIVNLNEANPTLTVNDGGVMNLKGLSMVNRDGSPGSKQFVITLAAGASMHLGSSGIGDLTGAVLNLNGGTIGILDSTTSWNTAQTLALGGDVAFDTRLYTAATNGTAGTYNDNRGGTITLDGEVSGTGSLIKEGAGTLELNAANTYAGETHVRGGELKIAGSVGNDASDNAYIVDKGAKLTLSGSGSIANSGASVTVRNVFQTLADGGAATPGSATFENVRQTTSGMSNANGTDRGIARNAAIRVTGESAYGIEKIDLVNSLVTLQSSATLTLNDVAFDANSSFEKAAGATGNVVLTGTGNALTVGLTGKTTVSDTTIVYSGNEYAQAATSQLSGVQWRATASWRSILPTVCSAPAT